MAVQAKKKVKMFFGAIGAGNWEKLNKFIILPLVIFRAVAQFFSSGRAMFQIHTNKDSESVRGALRRLIAGNNCASGQINGDTFRLYPKTRRHGTPVTFYGRIMPDRDGSLIRVWSVPHWSIVIFFPIWVWFGRQLVHAPWWFIILGLVVCIISFIFETRRDYGLLRENVA
jgi:hypothetical protein